MYHFIVRKKIIGLFSDINKGNATNIINGFDKDNFIHTFVAQGALGGRRTKYDSLVKWYDRLFKIMPDIHFKISRIEISGMPWNTIAYVHWYESNSGTDGVRTYAYGYHIVKIVWGKMRELLICPDATIVKSTLDRLIASGNQYASLPAIADIED